MFVAVVGIVGVVGVVAASDDHSKYSDDYSDYSRHSQYSEYGDAGLVSAINDVQNAVNRQESDIGNFRRNIEQRFYNRVEELKREANYSALDAAPQHIVETVKAEMQEELNEGIREDRQRLEEIDGIIARLNETELTGRKS